MKSQENYKAIPIGMDLGTFEITLDEELLVNVHTLDDYCDLIERAVNSK